LQEATPQELHPLVGIFFQVWLVLFAKPTDAATIVSETPKTQEIVSFQQLNTLDKDRALQGILSRRKCRPLR